MRRMIRSYLALTPFLYRIVLFVFIPIAIIAMQQLFPMEDIVLCTFFITLIMVFAEILMDYWLFGGISTRDGAKLEYLKTSNYGIKLMKNALTINMVRQLIESSVMTIISIILFLVLNQGESLRGKDVLVSTNLLLLEYVVVVMLLTVARFFDGWQVNMFISYAGVILMLGGCYLVGKYVIIMFVLLVVLALLLSALSINIALKRVRECYYDKAA